MASEEGSHKKQLLGSLVAATIIALVTILVVTANLGEGLEPDELEDRRERIEEIQEERREQEEERREEEGEP